MNKMFAFNGVSLEELASFDPPEISEEQRQEALIRHMNSLIESLQAIMDRTAPLNNLGGTIVSEVEPVNCIIGRHCERKYYPGPFWIKKTISVVIQKADSTIVRVRAMQYIPSPRYVRVRQVKG